MNKKKHISLVDQSQSGKHRPWNSRKRQSLGVAVAFEQCSSLKSLAMNIGECGSWLKFNACPAGHEKKLSAANFCRLRDCVMCQWRRSLKLSHQVYRLGCGHLEKHKSNIPLFLTLTVPNCSADDFPKTLSLMYKAFNTMFQKVKIKRVVRSWFRGLEITYNEESDTYHPHFHVLLVVPGEYFRRSRNFYIGREEWLVMWQYATGLDSITQVDIRRWRKRRNSESVMGSVAFEVAKYMVKPSSYLKEVEKGYFYVAPKVMKTLHNGLRGRRLVGFGGVFKKLRKELQQEDIEKSDLVHIDEDSRECNCTFCGSAMSEEPYIFHFGLRLYVAKEKKDEKTS